MLLAWHQAMPLDNGQVLGTAMPKVKGQKKK
jgi:hypothetical protein